MARRRRRRNPSWIHEHPWMTFFIASSVINGIVTIVRPDWLSSAFCPKLPAPAPTPALPAVTTSPSTMAGLAHPVWRIAS